MASIPEEYYDLLIDEMTFAAFATLMPNGTPHVTPVWVDYDPDEDRVLVNTERGRRKVKNVQRNPRIGMNVPDPEDPWRWISILGEVDEITAEGARDHIDELSQRYLGEEEYGNPIQTERIILKIRADDVITYD